MSVISRLLPSVCTFFVLVLGINTFADVPQCAHRLKVGVSLPLTAGAVSSGEAVRQSILLADEKYDASNCVEFLFEDDQLLAKNTVTNVQKFLSHDAVNGLIVYGTATSIAAGQIVEQAKVPMIALSILGAVVQDKQYIMKHWCTAERLTESIVHEVRRRGYKRVAVVSTQNDAMFGLRDQFRASAVVQVVADLEFVRDEFDFRSTIIKLLQQQADAVYVLLYPPQTAPFVKQLRELRYGGDAFGVHNIEDPNEVAASGGAMVGMWFANADDSRGENYREDYRRRFGSETSLGGGSGFDAAKMFIQASGQSQDVNQFLHRLKDFSGSFGTYNATGRNDFDMKATVKEVTTRGFESVPTSRDEARTMKD